MNMVCCLGISASCIVARFVFHKFLKAVFGESFVFLVICFVFLCKYKHFTYKWYPIYNLFLHWILFFRVRTHTHVCFVLEGELARSSSAVEMRSSLSVEWTRCLSTVFGSSESLETFLYDSGVLPMVVTVHLYIGCTDVHLITSSLRQQKYFSE